MNDQPRYATLRDYLRVVRKQKWLILVVTLAFGAAALALSLSEKPTYESEAFLAFQDPSQDAQITGTSVFPTQAPDQRAASAAEVSTRPGVLALVKKRVHTKLSVDQLGKMVSARPEERTNFVVITAKAQGAKFAARLANAVASEVLRLQTRQERTRFREAAQSLRSALGKNRRRTDPFTKAQQLDRIARLQALAHVASPVQVSKVADAPENPSSPKPVRNTVLGIVIGLTLALLVAFIRDSLDRRLRGAREIQEQLKLPMLGHVPKDAMGRVATSNNGHKVLTEEDLEAFRILRTNLEFLDVDNPPRVVLVTSGLAGEGKSTVASALASAAALAGKRALLVECDLRRPSLADRLAIPPTPGLSDYLAGKAEPREVIRKVADNLVCIVAGSAPPRPAEMLGSKKFAAFLAEVREAYEFVVLDTSPLLSVSDSLELVPKADAIVLCVRAAQTTQEQARAAKRAIEHLPPRPTGLVVTGMRPGDAEDYGYYSYAYGRS